MSPALPLDPERIRTLGAPVLLTDTCSILDLMRTPFREEIRPYHRQAGLDLLIAMEEGPRLVGLMPEQVAHELEENRGPVETETAAALARLKEQVAQAEAVATVYGGSGKADTSHLDDHAARAACVVNRWRKASTLVRQPAHIAGRAVSRVNAARTPASKGKQSIKDCVVVEACLEAAMVLRRAGFSRPIVFLSSNTRDYALPSRATPKPDLEAEFLALDLRFAPNMAAAKHMLEI